MRSAQTMPAKSSAVVFLFFLRSLRRFNNGALSWHLKQCWHHSSPTVWKLAKMSHKVSSLQHNWVLKSLLKTWEEVESTWLASLFLPTLSLAGQFSFQGVGEGGTGIGMIAQKYYMTISTINLPAASLWKDETTESSQSCIFFVTWLREKPLIKAN